MQALISDAKSNIFKATLDDASIAITPQAGKAPLNQSLKWDGEAWLNIQLRDETPKTLTAAKFTDNKLQWEDSKGRDHRHFIKACPNGSTEDGLLEHEIILFAKPDSNLLVFDVDCSPNIAWFRQRALTEEELKSDCDYVGEPGRVIGSYALYIDKAHNEYKTGKFCHLYALELTDAKGSKSYAHLNYDAKAKTLTATMDKTWLSKAVYPVIVDPEIGYHANGAYDGGSISACWATVRASTRYTAPANASVVQYSAYCRIQPSTAASNMYFACYTFNGTNPVTRLAAETSIYIPSGGGTFAWRNSNAVSQSLSNGTTYVLALAVNGSSYPRIAFDILDDEADDAIMHNTVSLPATWSRANTGCQVYSMYATVTVTEGITRSLLADIPGTSTTPSISSTSERALLSNIPATSTTPDIASLIGRALAANITGGSTTPAITQTIIRAILANIPGSSTTPDITAMIENFINLIALITGTIVTPDVAAATISRSMAAAIVVESATSEILAITERILTGVISGTSNSPDVVGTLTRSLMANITAISVTPDILGGIIRGILANVSTASVTPDIFGQITRGLSGNIQGVSATPDIAETIARVLSADIRGSAFTPEVYHTISRAIKAEVFSRSNTSSPGVNFFPLESRSWGWNGERSNKPVKRYGMKLMDLSKYKRKIGKKIYIT